MILIIVSGFCAVQVVSSSAEGPGNFTLIMVGLMGDNMIAKEKDQLGCCTNRPAITGAAELIV